MKLRKGDRFRHKENGTSWEYTGEITDGILPMYPNGGICVETNNPHIKLGVFLRGDFRNGYYDYLGNFSKSDNFNNLYEKLNGTT